MADWLSSSFHSRCKRWISRILNLQEKWCVMITKWMRWKCRLMKHVLALSLSVSLRQKICGLIMAIIKTITDLERIGDVANQDGLCGDWSPLLPETQFQVSLEPLCRSAGDVTKQWTLFARMDLEPAAEVYKLDDKLDKRVWSCDSSVDDLYDGRPEKHPRIFYKWCGLRVRLSVLSDRCPNICNNNNNNNNNNNTLFTLLKAKTFAIWRITVYRMMFCARF